MPNLPSHLISIQTHKNLKPASRSPNPPLPLTLKSFLFNLTQSHLQLGFTHSRSKLTGTLSLSKFASYFSNSLLKLGQFLSSGKLFRFPYHCWENVTKKKKKRFEICILLLLSLDDLKALWVLDFLVKSNRYALVRYLFYFILFYGQNFLQITFEYSFFNPLCGDSNEDPHVDLVMLQ